jgi:hypothetical protein
MFKKEDQQSLAKAYNLIREMNLGPAGAGLQPVGKPVIITMDLPGARPEFEKEEASEHEEEHDCSEIEMAAADLFKIAEYAPKLQAMVAQMTGLEGWVAAKITKASDYISSVYHWLEYQQHEGSNKTNTNTSNNMFNAGYEDSDDCCNY